MKEKLIIFFWLLLIVTAENFALYFIRKEYAESNYVYLKYGCIIYGLVIPYLLLKTLKYDDIGMVNFMWNVFSTISGFLIGYYLFGEKITKTQIIGVIISFVGLYFIIVNDNSKIQTE